MVFIYNIFIAAYSFGIKLAALARNDKARKWHEGRKDIFKYISSALKPGEKRVWFHCASLGEFEQGRPLIEKLRMQNAELRIVLTFFSPSGYEIRKNYKGADYIFYLPIDSRSNAKKFISLVKPGKVFFVKYEFWHHYFKTLKQESIPLYVISAIFRQDQSFFKWYGGFFRRILQCADHFFVQDEASKNLLDSINIKNVTVSGDTRFDRVSSIASEAKAIPVVEKFKNGKKIFIAGSSWPQDEEIFTQLIGNISGTKTKIEKFIIAPHEIGADRINSLVERLSTKLSPDQIVLFSKASESSISNATVLIIDNIGMLSSLYKYGDMAFVGGGFGIGIHNVLEPAVFGMPVFFGPKYQKFKEAVDLIERGGAFSIGSFDDLQIRLAEFEKDESKWKAAAGISRNYVKEKTGATTAILKLVG